MVHEVDDPLECALNYRLTAADHPKAQDRTLPQVLSAALGDRDIELVSYPRLDPPEHPSFPLKRVVLRKDEAQLQNPHDQRGRD